MVGLKRAFHVFRGALQEDRDGAFQVQSLQIVVPRLRDLKAVADEDEACVY